MEGLRGFPAIEQVAATLLILSSAALYCLKSQMESQEDFKFKPTKKKIFDYLEKKRIDPHFTHRYIKDIDDIYSFEPWDLANESITESEAYFFSKLYHKYKKSQSSLINRRTNTGSWNETGEGSKFKLRNDHTGTIKIFTFYRLDPGSKKVKTEWVMHEFTINDNPIYKKSFVLCHIGRKCDSKHGTSTPDEGESSQQLDSPIQISPSSHLISCRNRMDERTVTNPNQQLPNSPNLISHPQNRGQQTILANQQLLPNNTSIPYSENSVDPNMLTYPQFLNSISYIGNHIEQNTVTNQQPTPPNHNMISCPRNQIQEQALSNQQLLPSPILDKQLLQNQSSATNNVPENTFVEEHLQHGEYTGQNIASFSAPHLPVMVSYPGNRIEQNTITSQLLLPPNQSMISLSWNHIYDQTISNQHLPPNLILEQQRLQQQSLATNKVAENTLPEENLQHGEYSALDKASFPAPKPPIYPPQEISNSSCSINDCNFFNSQFDDDQVNNLINLWACQDENSPDWTNPYPWL